MRKDDLTRLRHMIAFARDAAMSAKELLTPDEAALLLKMTKRTILKWAREGKIESVRVSRKIILFAAEAIESSSKRRPLKQNWP